MTSATHWLFNCQGYCSTEFLKMSTAEKEGNRTPAAEELKQIAKAQVGAGIATQGKAPERTCLLAIGGAAMLDLAENLLIFQIVRLHAHCPADMFQSGDLIAQTVVCQGAEVVPPGIAVGGAVQGIEGFLVAAKPDVLVSGLLILVAGIGLGLIPRMTSSCAIPTC